MSDDAPITIHRWRYFLVVFAMLVVGVFLSYRALNIQVLENDFLQNEGDARHLRVVELPAHRGMILDRNDEVLAMSTPMASVWANPQTALQDHQGLYQLAALIDVPLNEIQSALKSKSNKGFIYLRRHVTPEIAKAVRALKIQGVSTQREYRRYYPTGEVAAHVVGFTDTEEEGMEGFEFQADAELKGVPGQDKVIQDRMGRIIDSVEYIKAPQAGKDIHLSIDKRLQYIAYRELKKAFIQHKAESASLVVLDVDTGEILAMVNYPAFNSNRYATSAPSLYRNLAITNVFEPGSTIKPFIAAAALKANILDLNTPINTAPGYMMVDRATIRDVRNYGQLDLTGVIRKSSNVGIVKVALKMDKAELWETLSDFGFGEVSDSGFPGEQRGYLPFFGEWRQLTQASLSFGYGVSCTPLQLAQSYALLANGGYLKPTSLYRVETAPEGRQVLSEEVAKTVLAMMETVVSREGTAVKAAIQGYRVAGKTGTMKKLGENGYEDDQYMAVFAGIVPASRPRLVGVVLFDNPSNGAYYGGEVAAPVFSRVMEEALRLQNIAPDNIDESMLRVASAESFR